MPQKKGNANTGPVFTNMEQVKHHIAQLRELQLLQDRIAFYGRVKTIFFRLYNEGVALQKRAYMPPSELDTLQLSCEYYFSRESQLTQEFETKLAEYNKLGLPY